MHHFQSMTNEIAKRVEPFMSSGELFSDEMQSFKQVLFAVLVFFQLKDKLLPFLYVQGLLFVFKHP